MPIARYGSELLESDDGCRILDEALPDLDILAVGRAIRCQMRLACSPLSFAMLSTALCRTASTVSVWKYLMTLLRHSLRRSPTRT